MGKQQITFSFNNHTRYLKFVKHESITKTNENSALDFGKREKDGAKPAANAVSVANSIELHNMKKMKQTVMYSGLSTNSEVGADRNGDNADDLLDEGVNGLNSDMTETDDEVP